MNSNSYTNYANYTNYTNVEQHLHNVPWPKTGSGQPDCAACPLRVICRSTPAPCAHYDSFTEWEQYIRIKKDLSD